MNEVVEKLVKIKKTIQEVPEAFKKREKVTDYCIVCHVLVDDPTRFTCDNPQCNRELLEYLGPEKVAKLLEEYDVENIKQLEEHIEKLDNNLKEIFERLEIESIEDFRTLKDKEEIAIKVEESEMKALLDDLEVGSTREARQKIKKMKNLIEEISSNLGG